MGMINYILCNIIENGTYKIFDVCPMYFFGLDLGKLKELRTNVLCNDFLSDIQKEVYLDMFSKAQRCYHGLIRFQRVWKFHKASFYDHDEDIYLNKLSQFPDSQKITLLQLNKKYVFRLTDLMTMWKTALESSCGFTPCPKIPNNPFLGIPFDKQHLYAIYFKLLDTSFLIPLYIHAFYKLGFDTFSFELQAYPLLKDNALNNYIKNSADDVLFLDSINMIEALKDELNHAYIDSRIPVEHYKHIANSMRPFLEQYFKGLLSCNPIKRNYNSSRVIINLRAFFDRHPYFGRLRNYYRIEDTIGSEEIAAEVLADNSDMVISDSEI